MKVTRSKGGEYLGLLAFSSQQPASIAEKPSLMIKCYSVLILVQSKAALFEQFVIQSWNIPKYCIPQYLRDDQNNRVQFEKPSQTWQTSKNNFCRSKFQSRRSGNVNKLNYVELYFLSFCRFLAHKKLLKPLNRMCRI